MMFKGVVITPESSDGNCRRHIVITVVTFPDPRKEKLLRVIVIKYSVLRYHFFGISFRIYTLFARLFSLSFYL